MLTSIPVSIAIGTLLGFLTGLGTGGGSLLYGLDRLIANVTGLKTRVADKPVACVAIGTGKALDNISVIPEGAINISRQRQQRF